MFRGRIAFGLSMVLWGRSILGRHEVPPEGLSKGFGILGIPLSSNPFYKGIAGIHTTGARMAPNLPSADNMEQSMEQNH